MSKKRALIAAAALAVLAAAAAASAGIYAYINRYDAGDYVQAVLDVSYKKQTELYEEITGTEKEEAEKIFENNLDATMEGFESTDMPEEMKPLYRELFGEIAGRVCYTVKEPVKAGRGEYEVSVTVKPVTLFPDTYDTFQEEAGEYADQITDSVMQGAEMPTEEEMQNMIYEMYYNVLNDKLDSGMLYGEPCEIVLHVKKEGAGQFEIEPEDMDRLDSALIEDIAADE